MTPCAWRLGAVLLGLAVFTLARGADAPPAEVISPPANAVLPRGPLDVICKGGPADLAVDGRPQPWGAFSGPARAARLHLAPGRHEVRVGARTLAVWVGGKAAPEGWQPVRLHPIAPGPAGCAHCHQTSERAGLTAVGKAQSGACLTCHRPAQFELKHAHPLEPLRHCTSCHAPHGAAHKGLLKALGKKLCAACHDS
jgi:predicted CXXCH cytochrome family protein